MNTTRTILHVASRARITRCFSLALVTALCAWAAAPTPGQSLIGYWNFNEASGTKARDVINNNDGTWQNGTNNFAWVAGGQIGRAVDLQGNNDNGANFFNVGTIPQFTGATQMTFSAWIQPDSQTDMGYNGIFASRVENWGIAYETDNHTDNRTANNATGGSNGSPDSTNIVLPNGNWYHAAMTFDTVTGAKRVYINGDLNASGTSTGFVPTAAAQFAIGMDGPTGDSRRDFDGRIDDLSLWNGVLSAIRVKRIYEGGVIANPADRVGAFVANTFTWDIPTNGAWGDASTWNANVDYPNLPGDVALLIQDHGAQDRIVTLNVSDANAHRIVFDDPGGDPDRGWIINPTAGQSITMTVTQEKRGYLESYNHATNVINAPIVMTGNFAEAYTLIDPDSTLHLAGGFTYTTPAGAQLRARLDGKLILGGVSEVGTISVRPLNGTDKAALNVDLDGGKLTLNRLNVNGANAGRGLFDVKNGGELIITGSGSQFFVGGGSYTDSTSPAGGAHTLTLTDGTITSDAPLILVHNGGDATAQLNGGTLTVPQIRKGTGTDDTGLARLQLNGVTIKPIGNSTDFLTSDLTARVWNGGVVFDTDGFDVTINAQLLNQSGANFASVEKKGAGTLTLANENNFVGGLTVTEGTVAVTGTTNVANRLRNGSTVTISADGTFDVRSTNPIPTSADAINFVIDGGILQSSNGANHAHAGNVTLNDGALWTTDASAGSTGGGSPENFRLYGDVTVGGTSASTINLKDGLGLNFVDGGMHTFDVGDVTGDTGIDLFVNTPLRNSGSLIKDGPGTMQLTEISTFTGTTTVSAGELRVDGDISSSSGVTVDLGARLSGTGFVPGIDGAGLVSPGTSPGILTSTGSVDPTGGLDFAFEFTAPGSPDYVTPTASINDVLLLTDATPFTAPLTSDNTLSFYFDLETISKLTEFRGGFFEENESFDLLSAVENADLEFFVRGDGNGLVEFNGTNYYPLALFDPNLGFNLSTALENDGRVLQLTSTPEPASIAMWLGLGAVALLLRRRFLAKKS